MTGGDWRPSASLEVIRQRAQMLARVRGYFSSQGVIEVQTPVLSAAAPSDPQIEPVAAQPAGGAVRWLQTSPEFPMKRLLAAGVGDCYQVCPVFRDGEAGRIHGPEFTLVEWYRVGFSAADLRRDVERLLQAATRGLRPFAPARELPYREAIREACGIDCRSTDADAVRAALAARGIEPADDRGWDLDAWLDLLVGALVGPALGRDAPVFVTDYPPSQASLARLATGAGGMAVAERFELYVDGIELANGFGELGDAAEQRRRFGQDVGTRRRRGQRLAPLDERLLAALEHGLPDCSGVALGFDRLVMVALGLPDLASAMCFAHERA
ncbi:MAG TPA: EF-P lysine aminoacylase EpmA [Steroidobacteraceae bacterium]|nr:EF-P lysine aminoacylase EpmA [Steroidobacteraceae bacterium]